jgi:hypothetical protein
MFTKEETHAHIRPLAARLFAPVLPLLAYALAGLLLSPIGEAQAQSTLEPNAPAVLEEARAPTVIGVASAPWQAHFGEYAANVLRTAGPEAKQETMQNLIAIAVPPTGSGIDLSATLPQFLEVIEHSPREESRLMAVQALQVIGTDHARSRRYRRAMEELYRIVQKESSDRVRRAAASALHNFYGENAETQ